MTRKQTGITLLSSGILIAALAIFFIVWAIINFINDLKPVAEVQSGETTIVHLKEPGAYTFWADNSSSIPTSGLTHTLTKNSSGAAATYKPMSMSATRTYGSTSSQGLGTYEISAAGKYAFTATDPSGAVPQFSLTAGAFGFQFIQNPLIIMICILSGFLALALVIVGVILLVLKSKTATAPPSLPRLQP